MTKFAIIDAANPAIVRQLAVPSEVLALAPGPHSDVWLACRDGRIRWLDATSGEIKKTITVDLQPLDFVAVSPNDENTIAVGGDYHVTIINAATESVVTRLPHSRGVANLAFLDEGTGLLTIDDAPRTRIWRAGDWQEVASLDKFDVHHHFQVAKDGRRLLESNHFHIRLIDARPRETLKPVLQPFPWRLDYGLSSSLPQKNRMRAR